MAIKSNIFPSLLSILVLFPIILIIIAGVNPKILPGLWFLRANVTDLSIPSLLSNSALLTDLTALTGTDLVGQTETATSLELAKTYTLYLLTSCATDEKSTICSSPRFGFHFDPASDLKLKQTSIVAPNLKNYSSTTTFLSVAYVISAIFTFLASIFSLVRGKRFPRAVVISSVFSSLTTIFMVTATIVTFVGYRKVKETFDDSFSSFGIYTVLGRHIFGISCAATLLSIIVTVYLITRARRPTRQKCMHSNQGFRDSTRGDTEVLVTGGDVPPPIKLEKAGFMSYVPFVGRHGKYTQVEKQEGEEKEVLYEQGAEPENDWDPLVRREEEEDYVPDGRRGISILPRAAKEPSYPIMDTKDISTAYEPFRRQDEPARYTKEQPAYDAEPFDPHGRGYAL